LWNASSLDSSKDRADALYFTDSSLLNDGNNNQQLAVAFFPWRAPPIDDGSMGGEPRKPSHSRSGIEGGARGPGISSL
jgi:hypothetical protein